MEGFHHKAVNEGVQAMRLMAKKRHFNIDWHEDANMFSDERLARYDAIVFLMTTGSILNEDQQAAMQRFIQSGKGLDRKSTRLNSSHVANPHAVFCLKNNTISHARR